MLLSSTYDHEQWVFGLVERCLCLHWSAWINSWFWIQHFANADPRKQQRWLKGDCIPASPAGDLALGFRDEVGDISVIWGATQYMGDLYISFSHIQK